jgi:hypothetical protein
MASQRQGVEAERIMADEQAPAKKRQAGQSMPLPGEETERPPEREPGADTEIGGPTGPEPTRYGDWERKGRCIDF